MQTKKLHPLQKLEGKLGRDHSIKVVQSRQLRKAEQSFFQIFIINKEGRVSKQSVFEGLYSTGIKPYIDGWIDGHYYEEVEFGKTKLNLSETGLDLKLFKRVGKALKPSWSFMVAYETFGKAVRTLQETSQGLNCGIPPIATPLGYLLFSTGRLKVKDWYFPEGGNEGMPKLEGIGAVDKKHAERIRKETAGELKLFLKKGACHNKELEVPARKRAEIILRHFGRKSGRNQFAHVKHA
ncbi:MAG: DUF1122 family protein [Candidatus Micrarchaeota archaeon]|nr:DUF1122 family protein [Candidatus Micrarchaeota archaeon]